MKKQLGSLYTLTKSWIKGLIVPLIVGLLLGTTDVAKQPYNRFYPDGDHVGGVAFPLAYVSGTQNQPVRLEFVLVRQSLQPMTKFEFIRRGAPIAPYDVFAGLAADRIGNATALTGGINGMRYLSLELPEKTLGGATLAVRAAPGERPRYVVAVGNVTKDLAGSGDLIIQTKNEARQTVLVYLAMMFTLCIVSFYVARSKPLEHPADKSPEDMQWV